MRSCDLQDSSVLKLFPHLLHKTPTLWDIIWHFINLSVFLTFPQISQEKTSFSSVKSSSTAVTCDQMFATCVENNQIFVPTSENTWNYESGGTRQCAEQSYAPWKKEKWQPEASLLLMGAISEPWPILSFLSEAKESLLYQADNARGRVIVICQ